MHSYRFSHIYTGVEMGGSNSKKASQNASKQPSSKSIPEAKPSSRGNADILVSKDDPPPQVEFLQVWILIEQIPSVSDDVIGKALESAAENPSNMQPTEGVSHESKEGPSSQIGRSPSTAGVTIFKEFACHIFFVYF
jgi:hypothetical protein